MRFIVPIILLVISVASFVMFTNPSYQEVKTLRAEASDYNAALGNSKELQRQRDELGAKYSSITPDSLSRLSKLLPDNADNIRLIIDIQHMAESYGMTLSSIKFDSDQESKATPASPLAGGTPDQIAAASKSYGVFNLEFSTTAPYDSFLKLLKDIESSLRLTDIESIDFSSDTTGLPGRTGYLYTVKLRTYWLKG